jgi:ABC-type nitrate/sulfonate/bicarbonate transport system permease component
LAFAVGVLFSAALVLLWHALTISDRYPLVPTPADSFSAAWDIVTGPELRIDVLPSVARTLMGYVIGCSLGIALGITLGYFRTLDPWARPSLEFFRAVPLPAVLPIAILVIGPTNTMRIAVIGFATFWPVLVNALDGTRSVEPTYVETARVAGLGRFTIVRRVIFPAALPAIFAGMRTGLGTALVVMVLSEMVASSNGLGFLVLQAQRQFNMPQMVAGVILLGVLGVMLTAMFSFIERHVLVWYHGLKGI